MYNFQKDVPGAIGGVWIKCYGDSEKGKVLGLSVWHGWGGQGGDLMEKAIFLRDLRGAIGF